MITKQLRQETSRILTISSFIFMILVPVYISSSSVSQSLFSSLAGYRPANAPHYGHRAASKSRSCCLASRYPARSLETLAMRLRQDPHQKRTTWTHRYLPRSLSDRSANLVCISSGDSPIISVSNSSNPATISFFCCFVTIVILTLQMKHTTL